MANPIKPLTEQDFINQKMKKKNELEKEKSRIQDEADITKYITVSPEAELALMQYYTSSVPGVEFDPSVKEFWTSQQEFIRKLDTQGPVNDYLNAFRRLQDCNTHYDEIVRDTKRDTSFEESMRDAKKSLKEAEERASKQVKSVHNEVSPFAVILSVATGSRTEFNRLREAQKSASESVINAKERIQRLEENHERQQARITEKLSKLQADMYFYGVEMAEAREKLDDNRLAISGTTDRNGKHIQGLDEASKRAKAILAPQYAILDKYLSIQKLKSSKEYPKIHQILQSNDPRLCKDLDRLPSSLPPKTLTISLLNPLTLSSIPLNQDRLDQINGEMDSIKQKLPKGTNFDNIQDTLARYTVSDGETIQSVKNEQALFASNSPDYLRLAMKIQYMELREKLETTKVEIETLKKDISSQDPSKVQGKLSELRKKQNYLKYINEEIQNCDFTKAVVNLKLLQAKSLELEQASAATYFTRIDSVSEELDRCNLKDPSLITSVANLYRPMKEFVAKQIEASMEKARNAALLKAGKVPPTDPSGDGR